MDPCEELKVRINQTDGTEQVFGMRGDLFNCNPHVNNDRNVQVSEIECYQYIDKNVKSWLYKNSGDRDWIKVWKPLNHIIVIPGNGKYTYIPRCW